MLLSASLTSLLRKIFTWECKLLFWAYRVNWPKGQDFKSLVPHLPHKGALTCLSVSKSPLEDLSTQILLSVSLHSYVWVFSAITVSVATAQASFMSFGLSQQRIWRKKATAAFQWSECRSFHQWGGKEAQKTCIGNPATVLVGKATSSKWPVQISLSERARLISQQMARLSWMASDLSEGAQR